MQVRIEYDSIDVVQISPNVLIISNHGMWLVIRGYVLNRNMNQALGDEPQVNKINLRGHEVINNDEIDGSKVFKLS